MSKVVTPPTNPITRARKIEVYIETDDAIVCIKGDNLYDLAMECYPVFADIKGEWEDTFCRKYPLTNQCVNYLSKLLKASMLNILLLFLKINNFLH